MSLANEIDDRTVEQVELLRSLGVNPFVMPYNRRDTYQRVFARWVNHKAIFKSVKWQDYKPAIKAGIVGEVTDCKLQR